MRSRVVMADCHGMGRGKTIRRHEMEALHLSGRPMPSSLFGQDIAGDDVEATGLVLTDGGATSAAGLCRGRMASSRTATAARCWSA